MPVNQEHLHEGKLLLKRAASQMPDAENMINKLENLPTEFFSVVALLGEFSFQQATATDLPTLPLKYLDNLYNRDTYLERNFRELIMYLDILDEERRLQFAHVMLQMFSAGSSQNFISKP